MLTHVVSELSGVSVRTLHHYDNIGLLRPSRRTENGYRDYSDRDLDRLQQILLFRACGFSLENIQTLLDSPSFDRKKAFLLQKKMLVHEKERIDAMLATLEKSMQSMKGEISMSSEEKFKGFDFSQNPYEEEARRLWGEVTVEKSKARIKSLSKEEKEGVADQMDALFCELSALRAEAPDSEAAQMAMERMFQYFNENFGNIYTPEMFAGLGKMYVCDSRFVENIDKYGDGLAAFLEKAMSVYAENHTK